ncbi:MAG: DNA-binding protein [Halanaerobiales bacterium]|nr:DNA-binding protein [Halanaerobiales bacterium]
MLKNFKSSDIYMGRLEKNDDLLKELTNIVQQNNIEAASIKVIGAVQKARIEYYDQDKFEYKYKEFDQALEIVSCIGNISILEGKPFIHAHIILADREGNCYGGHLAEGSKVFAAEFVIQTLQGNKLIRKFQDDTKLKLW